MNKEIFFNMINNLPKTDDELNKQKKYGIFMGAMIILTLIISIILFILDKIFIGFTVSFIGYGITIFIGINKRKKILNNFFRVKEAHKNINFIKTTNEEILKFLYEDSALTFVAEETDKYIDEYLDFIYNWLNNQNALKDKMLNLYVFNGKLLKKVYKIYSYSDDINFFCISLNELNLKNNKVSEGHLIVGLRWLDDIINNEK